MDGRVAVDEQSVRNGIAFQVALETVETDRHVAARSELGGGAQQFGGEGLDTARQKCAAHERVSGLLGVVEEPFGVTQPRAPALLVEGLGPAAAHMNESVVLPDHLAVAQQCVVPALVGQDVGGTQAGAHEGSPRGRLPRP
ncbi:hypothetical protein [Streptomyces beijiangensis]|uniref:hypothetical protein n=1 Tax=Streptomyces beijiangensis TaxID=163361 RepID=UPI0031D6BDB9